MNESVDPVATRRRSVSPIFPEVSIARLRSARFRAQVILFLGDAVLLFASFVAAAFLYGTSASPVSQSFNFALQLVPFYLIVAAYQGAYSVAALKSIRVGIARFSMALLIAVALRLFMTFVAKSTGEFSRGIFILSVIFGFISIGWFRFAVLALLHKEFGKQLASVLIVESGGPPVRLDRAYRVDTREWAIEPEPDNPAMLDRFGRMARNMDRVIISCPEDMRTPWSLVLKGLNVPGEVVSEKLHEMGAVSLERSPTFTSLVVSAGPLGFRDRALKRMFDLALTVPIVILLLPVLVIVAIAIKLEDGGPIFFVQDRMGRANCTFKILKFRSMSVADTDSHGSRSASKADERITRIGRFIRRTSIDELPQLLNVINGDMSLVGPRPHALGSRAGGKLFWEIDPNYWHRHALKPGLTGLAQVRGHRGATDSEEHLTDRLQADLEYLSTWSLWHDFVILVRTMGVVVHDRAF